MLEEGNIPESALCLGMKIQFLFWVSVFQLSWLKIFQATLKSDWIQRMSQKQRGRRNYKGIIHSDCVLLGTENSEEN